MLYYALHALAAVLSIIGMGFLSIRNSPEGRIPGTRPAFAYGLSLMLGSTCLALAVVTLAEPGYLPLAFVVALVLNLIIGVVLAVLYTRMRRATPFELLNQLFGMSVYLAAMMYRTAVHNVLAGRRPGASLTIHNFVA